MSLARIAFAFTCLIHPVAYGQGLPDQSTNTVRTLKPNKDPLDTIDLDFTAKTIETLRKVKDELKASFGESAVLNAKEAKALELAFLQEELALKVPEILEESSTSDKSDQKDPTASTEEEITEIYKLYLEALKMTVATTLMNKASTALLTKLQGKAPFVLTIEFLSRLIQTGDRALIKDKLKPEVFAALSKQDQDRFVISLKMILNVSSAQPDLLERMSTAVGQLNQKLDEAKNQEKDSAEGQNLKGVQDLVLVLFSKITAAAIEYETLKKSAPEEDGAPKSRSYPRANGNDAGEEFEIPDPHMLQEVSIPKLIFKLPS